MKTYADKKAYEFSMPWKRDIAKLQQLDVADIRELISEVIEDCAKEAEDSVDDNAAYHADRIRALNTKLLP